MQKGRGPQKKIYTTAFQITFKAVEHVNFNCQPGRIYTLLGPNGDGKIRALEIIASLLKLT